MGNISEPGLSQPAVATPPVASDSAPSGIDENATKDRTRRLDPLMQEMFDELA